MVRRLWAMYKDLEPGHVATGLLDAGMSVVPASDYDAAEARIRELEMELAQEKGGWAAFHKLRKAVAERDFPGMTGEVTAKETKDV